MRLLNSNDVANLANNQKFIEYCNELYSGEVNGISYQIKRYQEVYNRHCQYSDKGFYLSSPGRIEVCGNHTDHNNGKVLCASISVDTLAFVSGQDNIVTIASAGYPPVHVNINDLEINHTENGKSEALVRGVLKYYLNNGYKIGGFYATTDSDVFKGAGVSSSACFEVLICEILNVMFNGGSIDPITKAKASHFAESVYFGKPCGLMDQSAIAIGGVSYIDFENPSAPKVEKLNWNFDVPILLVNCGGDHCNLTAEYTSIRRDMEGISSFFNKKTLREVSTTKFYNSLLGLRSKFSQRAILRAVHFFEENGRVESAVAAIKANSLPKFKKCITESGLSSYTKLQNCYVPGSNEQPIPLALALVNNAGNKNFSSRVHGGGFAGTIIVYGQHGSGMKRVYEVMSENFGESNVFRVKIRNFGTIALEL